MARSSPAPRAPGPGLVGRASRAGRVGRASGRRDGGAGACLRTGALLRPGARLRPSARLLSATRRLPGPASVDGSRLRRGGRAAPAMAGRGGGEEAAEPQAGQGEHDQPEQGEEDEGLPERADRLGPQHHTPGYLVEVGQREDVGDPPHADRDRGQREDQPGQQHLRQHDHHRQLDGLALVLRHAGYQHSQAQGDEEEQQRPEPEYGIGAAERHAEDGDADRQHDREVEAGHDEIGGDLAEEDVPGAQRHHGQLLQRARLPLPDHTETGDDRPDEDQDHPAQAGDHDVRGFQLGVVEDRHLGPLDGAAGCLLRHRLLLHGGQGTQRGLGGKQLAPVDQHLRRSAARDHRDIGAIRVVA